MSNKVNVIRSIKKVRIGEKSPAEAPDENHMRETNWNNRFHLEKVPKYDAYNDKNYLSIKKLKQELRNHPEIIRNKLKEDEYSSRSKSKSASRLNKAIKSSDYSKKAEERKKKFLENHSDEINILQSLWDDLGVTESFKNIFLNISLELDVVNCKDFLDYEVNSLTKLASNLSKLTKEIEAREKTINLITQFCDILKTNELTEKILTDIIQVFKNLRVLSINIINYFVKVRESLSYFVLGGKFILENLNKSFNYDRNYLIKMKNDTDFLKTTALAKYFSFSNDSDPFLIALCDQPESDGKINVPINDEIIKYIKTSQFTILQDLIIYEVNLLLGGSQINFAGNTQTKSQNTTNVKDFFTSNAYVQVSSAKYGRPNSLIHSQIKPPLQTFLNKPSPTKKIEVNIRNKFNLQENKYNNFFNSISPTNKAHTIVKQPNSKSNEYKPVKTHESNSKDDKTNISNDQNKSKGNNEYLEQLIMENQRVEKEIERLEKKEAMRKKGGDKKEKSNSREFESKDFDSKNDGGRNSQGLDEDEDAYYKSFSKNDSTNNLNKKSSFKNIGLDTINEEKQHLDSVYNKEETESKLKVKAEIDYENAGDNIPVENNYIETPQNVNYISKEKTDTKKEETRPAEGGFSVHAALVEDEDPVEEDPNIESNVHVNISHREIIEKDQLRKNTEKSIAESRKGNEENKHENHLEQERQQTEKSKKSIKVELALEQEKLPTEKSKKSVKVEPQLEQERLPTEKSKKSVKVEQQPEQERLQTEKSKKSIKAELQVEQNRLPTEKSKKSVKMELQEEQVRVHTEKSNKSVKIDQQPIQEKLTTKKSMTATPNESPKKSHIGNSEKNEERLATKKSKASIKEEASILANDKSKKSIKLVEKEVEDLHKIERPLTGKSGKSINVEPHVEQLPTEKTKGSLKQEEPELNPQHQDLQEPERVLTEKSKKSIKGEMSLNQSYNDPIKENEKSKMSIKLNESQHDLRPPSTKSKKSLKEEVRPPSSRSKKSVLKEPNESHFVNEEIPEQQGHQTDRSIKSAHRKSQFEHQAHQMPELEKQPHPHTQLEERQATVESIKKHSNDKSHVHFEEEIGEETEQYNNKSKITIKLENEVEMKQQISDYVGTLFKSMQKQSSDPIFSVYMDSEEANQKIGQEIYEYIESQGYNDEEKTNEEKRKVSEIPVMEVEFKEMSKRLSTFVGELVHQESERVKTIATNRSGKRDEQQEDEEKKIQQNISSFVESLMKKNNICTPKHIDDKINFRMEHIKKIQNNEQKSQASLNVSEHEPKEKEVIENRLNSSNVMEKKKSFIVNQSLKSAKEEVHNELNASHISKHSNKSKKSIKSVVIEANAMKVNTSKIEVEASNQIKTIENEKKEETPFEPIHKEKQEKEAEVSQVIPADKAYTEGDNIDVQEGFEIYHDNEEEQAVNFSTKLNKEEVNIEHPHDTTSDKNLHIAFCEEQIDEFNNFYKFHIKKVPEVLRTGFNVKESIMEYLTGVNPRILTIEENNQIAGIAVICYENTSDNVLVLNVKHFSCTDESKIENYLGNVFTFIKNHVRCDQISVNVFYDQSTNELDTSLKNYFKNTFGFRLRKVQNLKDNRVALFVQTINENINNLEYMYEPTFNAMNYKINTFMGISEVESLLDKDNVVADKNVNFFNIMLLICEMLMDHNNYTCNLDLFNNEHIREMSNMCTKFLNIYYYDKTKLLTKFENNKMLTEFCSKFNELMPIFHSDIEMSLKFQNVLTKFKQFGGSEVLYHRITEKVKVMKNEKGNVFYSIPSTDSNLTLIVYEEETQNEQTLYENFYSNFYGLTLVEEKELSLWIPGFKKLTNNFYENINFLKDFDKIQLEKNEKHFKPSQFYESTNFELMYIFKQEENFKFNDGENDIVISRNFVCGISHNDISDQVRIPAIFLSRVTSDEFIKKM